jgi:hypothetical protein
MRGNPMRDAAGMFWSAVLERGGELGNDARNGKRGGRRSECYDLLGSESSRRPDENFTL